MDLTFVQCRDRPGHRFEIVQEEDVPDRERRGDGARLDAPRHVGQCRRFGDHRSGDAEARAIDRALRRAGTLDERRDHRRQIVIVERGERFDRNRARTDGRRVEQTEESLRTADVASENHVDFDLILDHRVGQSPPPGECSEEARLPSLSPDRSTSPLAGQVVVFTGKLSSLGRKDARAVVERLGGITADEVSARTTMLVIGSEGFGPSSADAPEKSNKLKRAEELNAQPGATAAPIRIASEAEFCQLAGVATADALKRQYHAVRDVLARYPALREDHLRYLVKCGIVRPVLRTNADRFFTFGDLAVIKQANDTLSQGIGFRSVVRALIAARQGQLELDFRLDAAPAKIITLRRAGAKKPPPRLARRSAKRE